MSTPEPKPLSVDAWKTWAIDDARKRGLDALAPILEGLAPRSAAVAAGLWVEGRGDSMSYPEWLLNRLILRYAGASRR